MIPPYITTRKHLTEKREALRVILTPDCCRNDAMQRRIAIRNERCRHADVV